MVPREPITVALWRNDGLLSSQSHAGTVAIGELDFTLLECCLEPSKEIPSRRSSPGLEVPEDRLRYTPELFCGEEVET